MDGRVWGKRRGIRRLPSRPEQTALQNRPHLRDFQLVSPRSLSLGITRIETIAQVTYTPDLSWTVVGIGVLISIIYFLRG